MEGFLKSCSLTYVFYKYLSFSSPHRKAPNSHPSPSFLSSIINACTSTYIPFSASHKSQMPQGRPQSHPVHCKDCQAVPAGQYTEMFYSFQVCIPPACKLLVQCIFICIEFQKLRNAKFSFCFFFASELIFSGAIIYILLPQHFLYFFPLPHGHGSFG